MFCVPKYMRKSVMSLKAGLYALSLVRLFFGFGFLDDIESLVLRLNAFVSLSGNSSGSGSRGGTIDFGTPIGDNHPFDVHPIRFEKGLTDRLKSVSRCSSIHPISTRLEINVP